jgi:SAM-dependent methyltransferase
MDQRRVSDTWERGDAYEKYIGRWSRQVAPLFLSWLGMSPDRRWLDVGCGTGALCAAILDNCSPSSVAGVEPSEGFFKIATKNLGDRVTICQGTAATIPLSDASVDVTVSGLVLNFVPDQRAALSEMSRVTVNGGTIAAYVWDYAGRMEFLRIFWDAAAAIDPRAREMDESTRFLLCRPEALRELFLSVGLKAVETTTIDIPTPFTSLEDCWSPFLGGQGPAPTYVATLDQTARDRLRDAIRERVPVKPDGTISLIARAWAVRANVSK